MVPPRSIGLPKPTPRVVSERERRAALARTIKTVRAAVCRRDDNRCRACARRRGHEIHHLQYRSHGGRWTTANCVLLCRPCHQDVHARILTLRGANADDPSGVSVERHRWW